MSINLSDEDTEYRVHLFDLPSELLDRIIGDLDWYSIRAASKTCEFLKKQIKSFGRKHLKLMERKFGLGNRARVTVAEMDDWVLLFAPNPLEQQLEEDYSLDSGVYWIRLDMNDRGYDPRENGWYDEEDEVERQIELAYEADDNDPPRSRYYWENHIRWGI